MLRLRPYVSSDANSIISWIKNKDIFYKWSAGRFGDYPLQTEKFDDIIKERLKDNRFYAFVLEEDNKDVGFFTFRKPGESDEELRMGFVIVDDSIRGKGYGKKMLQLGLNFAFNVYNANKVSLAVFDNNPIAINCYKGIGFIPTGVKESYMLDGSMWTCIVLEINK